jgi:iron-sulfur cluster repair protein YtfE (RIC family)
MSHAEDETPLGIQAELRAQHNDIRHLLTRAARQAHAYLVGTGSEQDLAEAIAEVRASVLEHNQREESLLSPLLAGRDRWSPARIARMLEEHAAEHAALQQAFVGTTAEIAERLPILIEDMDAHMAAEERTVLSPSVLR